MHRGFTCLAFDSLDSGLVPRKLHHYGLRGTILEWYRSYFSCRRQKTKVNQCSSKTKNVLFGTPQGSVLGHLIFIVFMNDVANLCDDVNEPDITLFADDMTTYIGCSSANIENLYLTIELFKKWFSAYKLTVNTNKTKYILFHRTRVSLEFYGKDECLSLTSVS